MSSQDAAGAPAGAPAAAPAAAPPVSVSNLTRILSHGSSTSVAVYRDGVPISPAAHSSNAMPAGNLHPPPPAAGATNQPVVTQPPSNLTPEIGK